IRFDREPYTWKSDSSQLLRAGELRLGSNLFHYGIIVVILGHFGGFLAPEWAVNWALSPTHHQLMAMVLGGIPRLVAITGLSLLLPGLPADPRILLNSRSGVLGGGAFFWLPPPLAFRTFPLSPRHMDGALFETLVTYVKGVVTFNGAAA